MRSIRNGAPSRFIISLCCLALIAPIQAAAPGADLASRIEGFQADRFAIAAASTDTRDWNDHRDEYRAVYRRWFPDDSLADLIENAGRRELTNLFYKTLDYLFDVGDRSERVKLEAVFGALEERGWADHELIEYMHRFLLAMRLFDEAKAFRQEYSHYDLPKPPPLVPLASAPEENERLVLRLINGGSALERQAIDARALSKVIVIGHPNCHFSRDAVAAIAADPELSTAMSADAIWLTGPFTSLTDGEVKEWNREHPAYAYRYAESKSDWPEVNYWGTPSFYFLKDGQLVKKVVGWPNDAVEQRKEALWAGLRAIRTDAGERTSRQPSKGVPAETFPE